MGRKKDWDKERQQILEQKYNDAKLIRRIVFVTASILFLLTAGIITGGFLYIKNALLPVDPDSTETIEVEIPYGSGVSAIAAILEENNIIKDATIFKYYVKFNNESGFQAGTYELTPAMTFDEIIASLKTGRVYQEAKFTLTIPEGLQLKEIAAVIAENTDYKEEDILAKLNDKEYIEKLMGMFPTLLTDEIFGEHVKYPLEGYLFPATYSFVEEQPSLEAIIEAAIAKTEQVLMNYVTDIEDKGMTFHEVLTMASLIEEEAPSEEDRKLISSVFYNRLKEGMMLQTDPTVIYAFGEHKSKLYFKDYEIDDPYNTYKIYGLPPGPIANSGQVSIEAALYPATTNYYYFLATDGKIYYSETFEEHNEKYKQYIEN